jgi:hypothetical protein
MGPKESTRRNARGGRRQGDGARQRRQSASTPATLAETQRGRRKIERAGGGPPARRRQSCRPVKRVPQRLGFPQGALGFLQRVGAPSKALGFRTRWRRSRRVPGALARSLALGEIVRFN